MIRKVVPLIYILIVMLLPEVSNAGINWSLDEPAAGFASNSVGDIVYTVTPQGDTIIWVGTGNGLSKSTDGGASWATYNRQTDLNENDISALACADASLWVACAYTKLEDGEVVPYGKGFNRSSNFGESWDSFIPWQVNFAGMLAYDIAIDDTTFWAACWYGGLIHCLVDHDSLICENVFVDSFSRNDFEGGYFNYLNNRFFSAVVDTNCPIQKRLKNSINDIFYDGKLIWVATQNGLHTSADYGRTYFLYDTTSGLNSNGVYCLGGDSTIMMVGLYREEETTPLPLLPSLTGADFSLTTDYGYTWSTSHPSQGQASSPGHFPMDIAMVDTVIWAACGEGGLIRSFNRGQTWENIFTDSSAEARFQEDQPLLEDIFTGLVVDTLNFDSTIVWAGTMSGVYKFVFTGTDSADTVIYFPLWMPGGPFRVVSIGVQRYDDQHVIWVGGFQLGGWDSWPSFDDIDPITLKSTDGGETWIRISYLDGIQARDFAIWDTTVWIATEEGLKRSKDGGEHWDTYEVIDSATGELNIPSYFTSVCTGLDAGGITVLVGSSDGIAISRNEGITWEVTKFIPTFEKAIWAGSAAGIYKFLYNQRSQFDTVLGYSQNTLDLTGDFVVSLAIQQFGGRKIIWAGTQPTYSGGYGISYTTDDGDSWNTTLLGDKVWNFAFDDSVIWAATSAGLKRSDDWGASWKVFNSIDGIYTTEFSSVAIIGGEVWAGSADGLAWSSDNGNTWDTVRTAVPIGTEGSETAYAYPSPFSPIVEEGQVTRIRYRPKSDGGVTVKIYDFAMQLVKTLEDNQGRLGGVEYETVWDGRNGKGEIVANGVYFFKVEAPGGQTEWGKVVVLK